MDKIKLINHSSIFISDGEIGILTDPWYDGFAFNDGWSLLYKNKIEDIDNLLKKTNFIFISHEHPDHFSIKFFKDYEEKIKKNKIKVLFQETRDRRVESFLKKKGFHLIILKNMICNNLSKNLKLTLFKQGYMDSSFLLETENFFHLNINDCEFLDRELNIIKKRIVNKNKNLIIYIQFSYAAYRSNDKWLQEAALYKLSRIKKISQQLNSKLVIPFASFIYFCHSENFDLNKHVNTCKKTSLYLNNYDINHCFLNPETDLIDPNEILKDREKLLHLNDLSLDFWDKKISNSILLKYENKPTEILEGNIKEFLDRIRKNNNIYILMILRYLTFKFFFGDVSIAVNKTDTIYLVNFFKIKKVENLKKKADINLSSDQFNFMLKQPFGFDTMLVSGRLKANNSKGLKKLATSIGFTVMNQSNYGVKIKDLFNKFIFNKIQDTIIRLLTQKS